MFGRRTTTDITTPTRAISAAKDGAMPAKATEAKPVLVEANRAAAQAGAGDAGAAALGGIL